jgi:oxygen-independent coproporphyrinogen-3 oxidase
VHARQRIPHERYAEGVLRELELRASLFEGRRAISAYFGGGTPGLWKPECIAQVVAGVRGRFGLEDGEITVEANPDDLPREQLEGLRAAGVNRLSIGVQSLEPKHLHTLGRLHGPEEARRSVREARAIGFTNLSLDLMFALPGQTLQELERDLDGLLALEPDHVSIYNLTIEERTAFHALARRGELKVLEASLAADMYERVMQRLAQAGFGHYEISSYARPGKRAVHNTLYWTGGEYLGLGCSAHSFRRTAEGGERFSVVRNVDEWLKEPRVVDTTRLDPVALEREAVWLGLRLLDGIDRKGHARLHGEDPVERHRDEVGRLAREGLAEVTPERLKLTPRGVLFADEVGARFL